jgi:hypothetical protein
VKYAVQWQRTALEQLAEIWLSASSNDRAAITAAARQIEDALQFDAHARGESRSKSWRIIFATPLAVRFEADPDQCVAKILRAWRYSTRRR